MCLLPLNKNESAVLGSPLGPSLRFPLGTLNTLVRECVILYLIIVATSFKFIKKMFVTLHIDMNIFSAVKIGVASQTFFNSSSIERLVQDEGNMISINLTASPASVPLKTLKKKFK